MIPMWKKFKKSLTSLARENFDLPIQDQLKIRNKHIGDLTYRFATTEDIPVLVELQRAAYGEVAWHGPSLRWDMDWNPKSFYILVEDRQKEPVAFIASWMSDDEAHISNLCIQPSFQRQGIGTQLLEAIKEASQELGRPIITLEVRVSNRGALALYKKFGFIIHSVKENYYQKDGEDAFFMIYFCDESEEI